MPTRVSDLILDWLAAWHFRRIYGYPGDGINGLTSALRRAGDRFEFVHVRHEESAALMACAHARFGGGLGVCMVTSARRAARRRGSGRDPAPDSGRRDGGRLANRRR